MVLNKAIIKKIREKTESGPEICDFLINLLEFESEVHGRFKTAYTEILEKACKEENKDENN